MSQRFLFLRSFPITTFFLLLHAVLFGLVLSEVVPQVFFVFIPGRWHPGTVLNHFMHSGWLHFGFNNVVLAYLGPILERRLGSWRYLGAILGIWILLIGLTWLFLWYPVVGFSGILMGLCAFGTLLFWQKPPFFDLFYGLLLANLLFGLHPDISFLVHFLGAVAGGMVYWGMMKVPRSNS